MRQWKRQGGCAGIESFKTAPVSGIDPRPPLQNGKRTAHRHYHRNMVAFGMFERGVHYLQDKGSWAHDSFWHHFYRPYMGTASFRRPRTVKVRRQELRDLQPVAVAVAFEGVPTDRAS